MGWILFLDDERHPADYVSSEEAHSIVWCKDLDQAGYATICRGVPDFMYLDHDLGAVVSLDYSKPMRKFESMEYLHDLADSYPGCDIPGYKIISANPVGAKNIDSFMKSWAKSREI